MLGTELIPAASVWADVSGSYWDFIFGAGWTGNGVKLMCDGSSNAIQRSNFWIGGKIYRICMTVGDYVSGYGRVFYDASTYTDNYGGSPYDIIKIYYQVGGIGNKPIRTSSVGFSGSITTLSVREVLFP
jgi:hypothetical protein